jgi:hypothetical protein
MRRYPRQARDEECILRKENSISAENGAGSAVKQPQQLLVMRVS